MTPQATQDVMSPQDMVEEAIAENVALRAEHARFRDALIDIASGCHSLSDAQQKAELALDGSAVEHRAEPSS
jgi:hypothetical protein